jgi:TPR repeat protein
METVRRRNQGYAKAQTNVGMCYDNGEGVSQDHKKTICYYRKAADNGDVAAQINLAICY